MLGSSYEAPAAYLPRSIVNSKERYFRQPKRLFSESDVSSLDSVLCWNSKFVLKRRLHTSRVTARRSTVPGRDDATGTSAITLDSSGWLNDPPVASTTAGRACRFRMLSSTRDSS